MLELDLRLSAFKSNPNGTATISFNNYYGALRGWSAVRTEALRGVVPPKRCPLCSTASTTNAESQQVQPTGAARARRPDRGDWPAPRVAWNPVQPQGT